jgi:DNA/RNA endonuclease YhcR with UshA esterase domain
MNWAGQASEHYEDVLTEGKSINVRQGRTERKGTSEIKICRRV